MCGGDRDNDERIGPAAQQLSKRGPIFIVDNKDILESIPTLAPPDSGQKTNPSERVYRCQ
jgi:hypothetical protein